VIGVFRWQRVNFSSKNGDNEHMNAVALFRSRRLLAALFVAGWIGGNLPLLFSQETNSTSSKGVSGVYKKTEKSQAAVKPELTATIDQLRSAEERICLEAIATLQGLGPEAKEAAYPLAWTMQNGSPAVHSAALTALGHVVPDATARNAVIALARKNKVLELASELDSPDAGKQLEAAKALRSYGSEARPATPGLLRHVKAGSEVLREACVDTLLASGPEARRLLASLLAQMLNANPRPMPPDKTRMFEVLTKLGADARPAIGALAGMLTADIQTFVSLRGLETAQGVTAMGEASSEAGQVIGVLRNMGGPDAVRVLLMAANQDAAAGIKKNAFDALAKMGIRTGNPAAPMPRRGR
jgi:hypothetical protein